MIVDGMGTGETAARQRIAAGKNGGQAVDSLLQGAERGAQRFRERPHARPAVRPPSACSRSRATANPQNSSATTLLVLPLAARTVTRKRWRYFARSRR